MSNPNKNSNKRLRDAGIYDAARAILHDASKNITQKMSDLRDLFISHNVKLTPMRNTAQRNGGRGGIRLSCREIALHG